MIETTHSGACSVATGGPYGKALSIRSTAMAVTRVGSRTVLVTPSLAPADRAALRRAAELSGHRVEAVHLVGGGSKNALLRQYTAVGHDAWAEASALLNSIGLERRAAPS